MQGTFRKKSKMIVALVLGLLLSSCSRLPLLKEDLKKKEEKDKINSLLSTRPLLSSDEFEFMKCSGEMHIDAELGADFNFKLWKGFGLLEFRKKSIENNKNIMLLDHQVIKGGYKLHATLYSCEDVGDSVLVENVGMCRPGESRIFKLKYSHDKSRVIGEEIIKQKIRYYAISKHYMSYSIKNIKYSYTQNEFIGIASFFKCI